MSENIKNAAAESAQNAAGAAEAVTHDMTAEAVNEPVQADAGVYTHTLQMNNEYCLAPEVSRSFQAKMAAKAAGIGSDVLDAMPIKDFNRITNAARSFLIDTGY